MQTKSGTCVGLFEACNDLPPLTMGLTTGVTLVRMDAGAFKLQVHTPHKTIVTAKIGGVEVLTAKVKPGITLLSADNLAFVPVAAPVATTPAPADPLICVPGVDEDPAPVTIANPYVGDATCRLRVSLAYYREDDNGANVTEHVFGNDELLFQFNTPADHDRAVVENYHRIAPSLDETDQKRGPICGCCQRPVSPDQVTIE